MHQSVSEEMDVCTPGDYCGFWEVGKVDARGSKERQGSSRGNVADVKGITWGYNHADVLFPW